MFKKLLSNLPFNPSLVTQLSFYSQRLKKEGSIRKLGLVFVALSLVVQIVASVAPSESTLARSGNDIIPGGFSSKSEAVNHCNANRYNFKKILDRFGITCQTLNSATTTNVNSRDYGSRLYSMGRLPYGKPGEVSVSITGAGTFYMRPLWGWDSGSSSTYKVLKGTRSDGTPFMILYNCGNLTIVGPPAPPPPPPPPPSKIVKCTNLTMSVDNNSEVKEGTSITVRGQATGKYVKGSVVSMRYRLIDIKNSTVVETKQAKGIEFKNGVAEDPNPRVFKLAKEGKYRFNLKVLYRQGTTQKTAQGSETGNCTKKVTVKKELPCVDVSDDDDAEACLILSKKARNDTQNIDEANNTLAKAGDIITYSLYAKNTSNNTAVKNFIFEENITDVLEYSDVVDLHGGDIDDQNIVRWPGVDIDTGATVKKQISVQIKDPIPNTPISSSNPGTFDCTLTNVFSDTVNINLNCGVAKRAEQVSTALPNTGPGETLAVAFTFTALAGYFFYRNRLMSRELDFIKVDYGSDGGS